MHCPFCNTADTKVIDSRLLRENNQVRRRRECLACQERFTSYEIIEFLLPRVIKRDGRRDTFNEAKLRAGLLRSLEKRPVNAEQIEGVISRIIHQARAYGEREIPTAQIGEWIMSELKHLDQIAYVRFASVYRCFQDVEEFHQEIVKLQSETTGQGSTS